MLWRRRSHHLHPALRANDINHLAPSSSLGDKDCLPHTFHDDESRDPVRQLHALTTECWARIAAEQGHAAFNDHPEFQSVMAQEAALALTPPRSIAGLVILLRQALSDLVYCQEGTAEFAEAVEGRTEGAIYTAIRTLEQWRGAAAQPATPGEERG